MTGLAMSRMALSSMLLLLALPAAAGEVQAVETFHATLLDAMRVEDQSARERLLEPAIAGLFDVERIAGISLGRTWRGLNPSQRDEFKALLKTLIAATYADRFTGFSGQQFVTDGETQVKTGTVVHTRLMPADGDAVALDYFMRDGRVFNIVADGVSDLSLRRADYNSIVKNEGYPALLAHIEAKIRETRSDE